MKAIWILVNCNSSKEAKKIGLKILKARFAACFDIFPRTATMYFWPPKTGKIEQGKGVLLILETLPKYFKPVEKLVKKLHSDKLPFIGSIEINNLHPDFIEWLKGELK
ncbi:MAG: divalent cation tolerance protein CutA [Patescibacteria group bacterium]